MNLSDPKITEASRQLYKAIISNNAVVYRPIHRLKSEVDGLSWVDGFYGHISRKYSSRLFEVTILETIQDGDIAAWLTRTRTRT